VFSTADYPFLSLFCSRGFKKQGVSALWPELKHLNLLFTPPTQGRLHLHTALRAKPDAPHCRFL